MSLENLPGIFSRKQDGALRSPTKNENPVVIVLGTSPSGDTETLYTVNSVSVAASAFGKNDGTLIRGLYEAVAGGAENIRLYRIGATAATLETVGTGVTITTLQKDADAGDAYKIFYEDSTTRLKIWRTSDDLLVYDNNPTYPGAAVDEHELEVTGTFTTGPGDIGTLANPLTLSQSDSVSGASYTAGSDGINLSRMELFEKLYEAYKLLENEDLDIVLPMNVYMDDASVADMTTTEVSTLNTSPPWDGAPTTYPTAGTAFDALGKVFAQEYLGSWYFWWDMDRDGVAEIYPAVGTSTTDAFGNGLESADFHEANFAYQLANFCYTQSEDNEEMIGMIGVLPPNSWSLKDISAWIGRVPTYTDDSAGNSIVSTNGTGLLGNKWMAGRVAVGGTGLPGHIIDNLDGLAYGGFIATDDGWPDGSQQKDRNEHLIDIGKYLSVVGAQPILANQTSANSYVATGAAIYGGFVSSLPPNSAPTNKIMPGVRLPFRISVAKHDALAGMRYVMFQRKSKGIVVADAPTAARPDSDYTRLTTVRIVKALIDAVRKAGEPYIGEPIAGARLASLETAIDQVEGRLVKQEYLQRYNSPIITSTPTQQVNGQADVELVVTPAFELRQITVYTSLSAS